MNRSSLRRRTSNLVGMVALLSLLGVFAFSFPLKVASQPPPRPTPTIAPYIELEPILAVGQEPVDIIVRGYLWPTDPGAAVILYWDDAVHLLDDYTAIGPGGEFETAVVVPGPWATPGTHQVIAVLIGTSYSTFAEINLVVPTPTDTPTATSTPLPTVPTNTPTVTGTVEPTATMRPVTPVVTGYPGRPPVYPTSPPYYYPTAAVTRYPLPTNTPRPRPTSVPPTSTPVPPTSTPVPTDTSTVAPSPTPTDTPTITPSPTATDTPTITPSPTATDTPLPTSTPTRTPVSAAPGTSEDTGEPAAGESWESTFLQGFIAAVLLVVLLTAFIIVVLVILLVVWRILRMRRVEGRL